MEITIWMLIKAWFKKLCGVQSPTQYIHGYKYQYDWLKALRREQKANGKHNSDNSVNNGLHILCDRFRGN